MPRVPPEKSPVKPFIPDATMPVVSTDSTAPQPKEITLSSLSANSFQGVVLNIFEHLPLLGRDQARAQVRLSFGVTEQPARWQADAFLQTSNICTLAA